MRRDFKRMVLPLTPVGERLTLINTIISVGVECSAAQFRAPQDCIVRYA